MGTHRVTRADSHERRRQPDANRHVSGRPAGHPSLLLGSPETLLGLQRLAGNRAVAGLVGRGHTLTVQRDRSGSGKDYYAILGLQKGASKAEIREAYKRLARTQHPDKGGDTAKFQEILDAYQHLNNVPESAAMEEADKEAGVAKDGPTQDDHSLPSQAQDLLAITGPEAQKPSFLKKVKNVFKKIGRGAAKVAKVAASIFLTVVGGPIWRIIDYYRTPKEKRKGPIKDFKQYIGHLKAGAIDPFGGGVSGAFATGLSFVANVLLEWTVAIAGWAALITGLIGLIPGAQAALVVSGGLGLVATLAGLGRAALNALLSVWSGIYAAYLHHKLPDEVSNKDRRFIQYMTTLEQLGTNVKVTFAAARDLGIMAATGGAGGAITQHIGNMSGGYTIGDKFTSTFNPSQAISPGMGNLSGAQSVYGPGGTVTDAFTGGIVGQTEELTPEGHDWRKAKERTVKKSELPTPAGEVGRSIVDALAPFGRMLWAWLRASAGMQAIKAMFAKVGRFFSSLKSKFSSPKSLAKLDEPTKLAITDTKAEDTDEDANALTVATEDNTGALQAVVDGLNKTKEDAGV